jgi:hypothetical protein
MCRARGAGLVQQAFVTDISAPTNRRPPRETHRSTEGLMGYNDDPEARASLNAAFTGLGFALVFLLIVGGITFTLAKNAKGHEAAGEGAPAAEAAQH